MIREIENAFAKLHVYRCFSCDPTNDLGLRIKLLADDEKGEVFTRITIEDYFPVFPASFTAEFSAF